MDGDEEQFEGFVTPSLIKQLRAILDMYPDDGQILKELLQNAEDAGATKVCFLYDEMDHSRDPEKLCHPDLTIYQGPSLYAYNNAVFGENDWAGIGRLHDSLKIEDPLKVGRFGLGFKSVLHLTDLPVVLSGDSFAFIDPNQSYFTYQGKPSTGKKFNLKNEKQRQHLIQRSDQIAPFIGLFDCTKKTFETGNYPGTCFRFPLRHRATELSNTVYGRDRVLDLFKSFMNDALHVLLFLKNVVRLEFYIRDVGGNTYKYSEVCVDESQLHYARECRDQIKQAVANAANSQWKEEAITVSYPLTVRASCFRNNFNNHEDCKTNAKWFICERLAGKEMTVPFKKLCCDKEFASIPLVGVALFLEDAIESSSSDTMVWQAARPRGQLFCFLPLPFEQESSTGLPVHVNGYFSVSQNRRHLKWPSVGQDVKKDQALLWNHCLLKEMIPRVYCDAVAGLIAAFQHNSLQAVSTKSVINALPNHKQVDEKWQCILQPLFSDLLKDKHLFCIQNNKWLTAADCILVTSDTIQDTQVMSLVCDIMQGCQRPVTYLPDHLKDMVQKYLKSGTYQRITPSQVREAMKSNLKAYENLSSEEKLKVLEYLVSDDDLMELNGLTLLPRADGKFVTFSETSEKLYMETSDHPRSLTRDLDHRFILSSLPLVIQNALENLGKRGGSQISLMNKKKMVQLLIDSIPEKWKNSEQPVVVSTEECQWLERLWDYLRNFWPGDLRKFRDQPVLVLMGKGNTCHVVPLSYPSTCIIVQKQSCNKKVVKVLEALGGTIVTKLVPFVQNHADVHVKYILPFTNDHVLSVLYELHQRNPDNFMTKFSSLQPELKDELCLFLSKVSMNNETVNFLKSLPMFQLHGHAQGEPQYRSVKQVKFVAPELLPPTGLLGLNHAYLQIGNKDVRDLAQRLGATTVTTAQVIIELLQQGNCILEDKEQLEELAAFIKDKIWHLESEDRNVLLQHAGQLPFVTTLCGYSRPCDLFDPEDSELQAIFYGEDKFPRGKYRESDWLQFLHRTGLKTTADVKQQEVHRSIIKVAELHQSNTEVPSTVLEDKAHQIIKYIGKHPEILGYFVNGVPLSTIIKDIPWIPVLQEKPDEYPYSLEMFAVVNSVRFTSPKLVFNRKCLALMGSVAPVAKMEIPENVAKLLEVCTASKLPLTKMLDQLTQVIKSFEPAEKAKYLMLVVRLYEEIELLNIENIEEKMKSHGITDWVWNGEGFTRPSSLCKGQLLFDMKPYCFGLPRELHHVSHLFLQCGMREECNSSLLTDILIEIKETHDEQKEGLNMKKDLQLCLTILNHLKEQSMPSDILIPTKTNDGTLRLHPVSECVYFDKDWLRQDTLDLAFGSNLRIVHEDVSMSTAEALGVPSMMSRMMAQTDDVDFSLEEYGQSQSLTCRLREILRDYTDGTTVFKELIQNADDAGASVVKFMYDERNNLELRSYLFDDGMKECQGPALWSYNDALFTPKDFTNLVKLGSASKEKECSKIGKFGLGFNSVYNLTDVPSLVSSNHFVVLDPHTTYLGKALRNKSKPGVRLHLDRHRAVVESLPHQFQPYNGIFGCNIGSGETKFDGTLFRFPLRTAAQSETSEICNIHYDKSEMLELLRKLISSGPNLLLFLNNVNRIEFYHIPVGSQTPEKLYEINRSIVEAKRMNDNLSLSNQVVDMSKIITQKGQNKYQNVNVCSTVSVKVTHNCSKLCDVPEESYSEKWLQSFVSKRNKDGLYIGAVAAPLCQDGKGYVVKPVQSINKDSNVFCFLPIPVPCDLPVHIHGNFAIHSNRRHLVEHTSDDKRSVHGMWNVTLVSDVICKAYKNLVDESASIAQQHGKCSNLTELWPFQNSDIHIKKLLAAFYQNVEHGTMPVQVTEDCVVLSDAAVYLDTDLCDVKDMATAIIQSIKATQKVSDLPCRVRDTITCLGFEKYLNGQTYTHERICTDLLFPNIAKIEPAVRNYFVRWAVIEEAYAHLMDIECIPVKPDGRLQKPSNLVNPKSDIAKFYDESDEVFPIEEFSDNKTLGCLMNHGMKTDLTWDDIVDRAKTVAKIANTRLDDAKNRTKMLLELMEKRLQQKKKLNLNSISSELSQTVFLPVVQKSHSGLPWKESSALFATAREAYPCGMKHLVSCTCIIVDVKSVKVQKLLGLHNKSVGIEILLDQWKALTEVFHNEKDKNEICTALKDIYKYANKLCDENNSVIEIMQDALAEKDCILIGYELIKSCQVVFQTQKECKPYLYEVPANTSKDEKNLFKLLGVQESCTIELCVKALQDLYLKQQENSPEKITSYIAIDMLLNLEECMEKDSISIDEVGARYGKVYIPNEQNKLMPSAELYFNSIQWKPMMGEDSACFTHNRITFKTAARLGIKTTSDSFLNNHAIGMNFGQTELLANSLRRITEHYSCDQEILKELIQNADDAGATVISFILDERIHKDERIFDEKWKPLQGPALLVYNNKPFTQKDIDNIQRLGDRTKLQDPTQTGQYGIGFCATYHMTDAPSFLTESKTLGKRLCVLDPLCKYVPGSTPQCPGRMFDVTGVLEETYTGVFSCYLGKHFPITDATMFRFPLRTSLMAETSEICKTAFTVEMLRKQLLSLERELSKVLLFTRNIKKISIYKVNEHEEILEPIHSVWSTMCEESHKICQVFNNTVDEVGNKMKERKSGFRLEDINQHRADYEINIQDTMGHKETWLIHQVVGFNEVTDFPEKVQDAYASGNMTLMPLGGVAYKLSSNAKNELYSSHRTSDTETNVSCFLPLPLNTGLPVHINCHFALEYENRRAISQSNDHTGFKYAWNKLLIETVLAEAYTNLLCNVKDRLHLDTYQMTYTDMASVKKKISDFQKIFPTLDAHSADLWKHLVSSVYTHISKIQSRLLPHIKLNKSLSVEWLLVEGEGQDKPYLYRVPTETNVEVKEMPKKDLQVVLQDCGMKIVTVAPHIIDGLTSIDTAITEVTPEVVVDFFRSYQQCDTQCILSELPQNIKNTPFKSAENLLTVVAFCKKHLSTLDSLDGIPFALTLDKHLREFDKSSPLFPNSYGDLFPKSQYLFLASDFYHIKTKDKNVFQELTIEAFKKLLEKEYPCLIGENPIERQPHCGLPKEQIVSRIWSFLLSDYKFDQKNRASPEFVKFSGKVNLLGNFCIFPVKHTSKLYYPIVKTTEVFNRCTFGLTDAGICDILTGKVPVPMYDMSFFSPTAAHYPASRINDTSYIVGLLSGSEKNRNSVVLLLHKAYQQDSTNAFKNLTVNDFKIIVSYLSDGVHELSTDSKSKLLQLPLYTTVCNSIISVDGCTVYTLPEGICTSSLDSFKSQRDTVFLAQNKDIKPLYDFLGFHEKDEVDVYVDFILPQFDYDGFFDDKTRHDHLLYLYKKYFVERKVGHTSYTDMQPSAKLMNALKRAHLVRDKEGTLRCAHDLYNPNHPVFKEFVSPSDMIDCDIFSAYENGEKVRQMLIRLGLKWNIDRKTAESFARKITKMSYNKVKAENLATVLFTYLITGEYEFSDDDWVGFGKAISDFRVMPCSEYASGVEVRFYSTSEVYYRKYSLVCAVAPVLPRKISQALKQCSRSRLNRIIKALKIKTDPPVSLVVQNLKRVCSMSEKMNENLKKIITDMYHWLQDNTSADDLKELRETNCVIVNNCKTQALAMPRQVSIDLKDDETILNHLHKVPPELGQYHELFLKLGVTKEPLFSQYNSVLESLSRHGDVLLPQEILHASKAIKNMFLILQESGSACDASDVQVMYLINEKGQIKNSRALVFNDRPGYYSRIQDCKIDFMLDLKECGLRTHVQDLVALIPGRFKPRNLSEMVSEVIGNSKDADNTDPLALRVHALLTSEHLKKALERLAKHEGVQTTKSNSISDRLDQMSSARVFVQDSLETHLEIDRKCIKGSEKKTPVFFKKVDNGNGTYHWEVHLTREPDSGESLSHSVLISLTKAVSAMLEGQLARSELHMYTLLTCRPEQMQACLDSFNIVYDASQATSRSRCVPVPGDPVHEHQTRFLEALPHDSDPLPPGLMVACHNEQHGFIYGYVEDHLHDNVYQIKLGNAYPESKCLTEIFHFTRI